MQNTTIEFNFLMHHEMNSSLPMHEIKDFF